MCLELVDLTEKTALITGSSRGLGFAIAEGLAGERATEARPQFYFTGGIDEGMLFNRPLSPEEINQANRLPQRIRINTALNSLDDLVLSPHHAHITSMTCPFRVCAQRSRSSKRVR